MFWLGSGFGFGFWSLSFGCRRWNLGLDGGLAFGFWIVEFGFGF